MTSWLISTPTNLRAKCKAEVPFTTAIAYLAPVNSAIFFSKSFTYLPTVET